jgi:hypothetical protein
MPVMLYSVRAPKRLEAVHVEVICSTGAVLHKSLLFCTKQLGANLLSRVCKSAKIASLARSMAWKSRTKALLEDIRMIK